jgi:hypothetical protein
VLTITRASRDKDEEFPGTSTADRSRGVTPVQVGVGQILALTENGHTLVQPQNF